MRRAEKEARWHALMAVDAGEAEELDVEVLRALLRHGLVKLQFTEAGLDVFEAGFPREPKPKRGRS